MIIDNSAGAVLDGRERTAATGYDPAFLATAVPAPAHADSTPPLPYTHFSLTMSPARRLAIWVAWNIDGAALKRLPRTDLEFVKDRRLPDDAQIGNELYRDNRLDRGHIARRADLLWGPLREAERANADSFFYTNIAPQMDDFNQSARAGLWGRLEDAVFDDAEVDALEVSVFGGPVLAADDRVYRGVPIPREYWKVLVFTERGALRARAFLLGQNLAPLEALELDEFRVFQVPLTAIEQRTGVRFPAVLHEADLPIGAESAAAPLDSLAAIRW
ncbi:DNA/RNA non-specific endonuclease [Nocardia harenae]|uniref:DNA/RNA non-specific endonuclease n=1 Tax=Nocardia harenae TaxID=358707 RepID=UPI00083643A6|nr:DNA/RNA non-specific endonuclease [Nocardia harenae]